MKCKLTDISAGTLVKTMDREPNYSFYIPYDGKVWKVAKAHADIYLSDFCNAVLPCDVHLLLTDVDDIFHSRVKVFKSADHIWCSIYEDDVREYLAQSRYKAPTDEEPIDTDYPTQAELDMKPEQWAQAVALKYRSFIEAAPTPTPFPTHILIGIAADILKAINIGVNSNMPTLKRELMSELDAVEKVLANRYTFEALSGNETEE